MTQKEKAMMAGQTYFVYGFLEVSTDNIIYIGVTRYVGRRLNEHRNGLKNTKNYTAIYVYMREHNLEFFRDVKVVILDYIIGRQNAQNLESDYIKKYSNTALNKVKIDTRKYNTNPTWKKVVCVTTGEIFSNVKSACEKFNTSRYLLNQAIIKNTDINGFRFKYLSK